MGGARDRRRRREGEEREAMGCVSRRMEESMNTERDGNWKKGKKEKSMDEEGK